MKINDKGASVDSQEGGECTQTRQAMETPFECNEPLDEIMAIEDKIMEFDPLVLGCMRHLRDRCRVKVEVSRRTSSDAMPPPL